MCTRGGCVGGQRGGSGAIHSQPQQHNLSRKQNVLSRRIKKMAGAASCIDILIAIILPPLGVFLKFGCGVEFWICLLLTILGYLPGIIYAVYAITK